MCMASRSEPRLLLSGSEWDHLPDKLQDPYFAQLAENNDRALQLLHEQKGETILQVPCTLGGPLTPRSQHDQARVLKNILQRSAVAWYLHHDPSHIRRAEQAIDLLTRPETWDAAWMHTMELHAELMTGDLLYCAAFALDVLGRHLDAGRIAALQKVIVAVGLPGYLRGIENGDWWRRCDFNWGTALHGQAGFAALAVEAEHPDLSRRVLDEARRGVQYVIERFPAGGGWTEGLMYQATMLGHLTDFAVALSRTHGDDLGLAANRALADMLDTRPYFILGDGYILNFSNANERGVEYCLPHAFHWARQLNRPEWTAFEEQHTKPWRDTHGLFHDIEAFWFRDVHQTSRTAPLERIRHCPTLDWFIWQGPKTYLAFRSGFNGGNHNNFDLGQIIFGSGVDRFLVDPGYGASATHQHSCVTVRGKDQTDSAVAKIFRVRPFDNGFYLACDLSPTFPHALTHYCRHLLLIDESHLLVVDDLRGALGRRTSAHFHLQTRCPWSREGDTLTLHGTKQNLSVRLLTGLSRFEAKDWQWADLPMTTLVWHDQHDTVHTIHAMLLSLRNEQADCRVDGDLLHLTLGGRNYTIDLAEGRLEC